MFRAAVCTPLPEEGASHTPACSTPFWGSDNEPVSRGVPCKLQNCSFLFRLSESESLGLRSMHT